MVRKKSIVSASELKVLLEGEQDVLKELVRTVVHQTLKQRGLKEVEMAVSDDHAGLSKALREGLARGGLATLLRPLPTQRP